MTNCLTNDYQVLAQLDLDEGTKAEMTDDSQALMSAIDQQHTEMMNGEGEFQPVDKLLQGQLDQLHASAAAKKERTDALASIAEDAEKYL